MSTPTMAALLQAMNGGPDAQESLRQAMAQHEDPRIRMIAEWAARQNTQTDAGGAIIDAQAVEEPTVGAETAKDRRRLLRRIRSLTEDLALQQETGDTLAAALGACYLCWGEDSRCDHCRGRGISGWGDPDPALFDEYIAPAIRRIEKQHNRSVAGRARDLQHTKSNEVTERSPS